MTSISPFASLDGKKPGSTMLVVTPLGANTFARLRPRCVAAALDTEYMTVPFEPAAGTVMPATEETIMMRDGSPILEAEVRRGENLG